MKKGIPAFGQAAPLVRRQVPLLISGGVAGVLFLTTGSTIPQAASHIDVDTLVTLAGLLVITGGIRESGFFDAGARHLARRLLDLRTLALFLVFLSAGLSAFFTNDIALFIVVPLTLSIEKARGEDLSRLVVFEALAVNAGSALTPIGNPQNIFLWHRWDISFPVFVAKMSVPVMISLAWLLLLTLFAFRHRPLPAPHPPGEEKGVDRRLFLISLLLLVAFVVAVELDAALWLLAALLPFYVFFAPRVVQHADWGLILLFAFLFVDTGLLCQLPLVDHLLATLPLHQPQDLFLTGVLLSQTVSNVPATLVLAPYTHDLQTLAWAVNTGGNGLLIASFANIIALRFLTGRKTLGTFHLFSLLFLLLTFSTLWFLLPR